MSDAGSSGVGSGDAGAIDEATYAGLVAMTGGDLEFIDELIDTYFADAADQLAALDDALAGGDVAALTRPAPSLKSSSANVGALRLSELGRTLEEGSRNGTLPDAPALVAAARHEIAAVRTSLLARRERR